MKIGFIGTGNMGKPMAANLIKAGHELVVHDARKQATDELVAQGARWADTPRAVAQATQVTLTSLPGPAEVEQVALGANGILAGAAQGHVYIDMSTSIPSTLRKIAAQAAARGVEVLDAPVTGGGVRAARRATLTIMVGGNRSAFESCEPILKSLSERIIYMGGLGAGYVAKLANNMMALGNSLIAMEAMVMGVKAGVDPQRLFEVVDSGSGSSWVFKTMFPAIVFPGKFDPPRFATSLAAKDVRLARDYARELSVPARMTELVCELLAEGMKQGLSEKDVVTYITLLEKAAGAEVRIKEA